MMFETTGILRYDPHRPGMKTRTVWWCVIELDDAIASYYRWFIDREWWQADSSTIKRGYHRPAWGAHVTVIRGERPRKNESDWKYRDGERISIRYDNKIRQTSSAVYADEPDKFWFVDAHWDGYTELRKHFGLPYERDGRSFRPHITVARTYD